MNRKPRPWRPDSTKPLSGKTGAVHGAKAAELGVCPAYPNSGTSCARVAGTLCGGEVQGSFDSKPHNCMKCDFYKSEHYSTATTAAAK